MRKHLVTAVVLIGALCRSVCFAAPHLFSVPSYVSNTTANLSERATSSDPSCPAGWLCNSQACSSDVLCPEDSTCIDFEGTSVCAPDATPQGTYCALNPGTLQAVECFGVCCHGQCYVSGTVCCSAAVSCSIGSACDACPQGQSCNADGTCSGGVASSTTTKTSTSTTMSSSTSVSSTSVSPPPILPTVVPSDDTFNNIGCFNDIVTPRTLQNGSLVASNMTVDVCVQFAIQGGWQYAGVEFSDQCFVGNDIFASSEPSGCDQACAGDATEICGGGDRIQIYQDSTWEPPTLDNINATWNAWVEALDDFQTAVNDWYQLVLEYNQQEASSSTMKRAIDLPITLPQVQAAQAVAFARSTALRAVGSLVRRRVAADAEEGIPLLTAEERAAMAQATNEVDTAVQTVEQATSNAAAGTGASTSFLSQLVYDLGADSIADAAVVGTASPLASAAGIWVLVKSVQAFLGALSGSGGGSPPGGGSGMGSGTMPNQTLPAPPSTTLVPAPVSTSYITLFTNDMSFGQYFLLTAWVYLGGGFVTEFIFDATLPWYAFEANLTDTQATFLAKTYQLTDSIFLDVPLTIVDEDDVPISTAPGSSSTPNPSPSSGKREETWKMDRSGNIENETNIVKRVPMANVRMTVADGWLAPFNGIQFWPFHLQWLSNLWAKNALVGNYVDVPWYVWDNTLPRKIVYVLDSGIFRRHQEFNDPQSITEGYDYTGKTVNSDLATITDSTGHGTAMAAMIVGSTLGVNPSAQVIPVKIKTDGTDELGLKAVIRSIPGVVATHRGKGNPLAVASLSIGISAAGLSNNLILKVFSGRKTDPFPKLIEDFSAANIIVVNSAPNLNEDDDPVTKIASWTPQKWGGSNTQLTMIASCDELGAPSMFVPDDQQAKGYISAYAIGEALFIPALSATGATNAYKFARGSSASAALASGLMSIFIAQQIVTTTGNAKTQFQSQAILRKGVDWPVDPDRPFAPRAASNVEVDCNTPNPANMYVATQYFFLDRYKTTYTEYQLGSTLTYAQYAAAYPTFQNCLALVAGNRIPPVIETDG